MANARAGTKFAVSKISAIEVNQRKDHELLLLIREDQVKNMNLTKYVANGYLSTQVSLDDVIPFETNGEIFNFMKKDCDFYRRKMGLKSVIKDGDQASMVKFIHSLSTKLFDDQYRATHRWPSPRYEHSNCRLQLAKKCFHSPTTSYIPIFFLL